MGARSSIPTDWLAHSAAVFYVLSGPNEAADLVFVSASLEELTGFSAAEAEQPGWWRDHVHAEDRARLLRRQTELAAGARLTDDYRFHHRDGHVLWIRDQRQWIGRSGDRETAGRVVGVWTEVTELIRAAAEMAVHAQHAERWERVFFEAHFGLAYADSATNTFLDVNPTFARERGYTPAELIGRPVAEVYPAEERAAMVARFPLIDAARHMVFETVHQRKDGSRFPVLMEVTTLGGGESGRPHTRVAYALDCTERKRAEDALRASEASLRKAQRFAHVGSWTWEIQSGRLDWSDEMFRLFGVDRETFTGDLGDIVARAIHPDDRAAVEAANQAVARDGSGKALEYRVIWPDGTVRHVYAEAGELERDPTGRPLRLSGVAQDITERCQAEEALRRSEELYRRSFTDHSAVELLIDPESGRLADANHAAARFYGWSREQLRQMRVNDLNPSSPEEIRSAIDKVRREQRTYFEFQHRRRDGSLRDVEVFSSRIESGGRELLHSIVHDVTDRKLAEAARARLEAAIAQSGEAIVVTDARGDILYVNPAFEVVSGYRCEEVLGQNPRLLKSGEQDAAFYREMWTTLTGGRTWRGRLANRRKDGTLFTEDATISPVLDAHGEIVNYVAVKRDITEELRLEDNLRQAQKMEAVGVLAGGVAHDFNNMLSVILGNAELALAGEVGSPLRERLEEIRKAAERSAGLTRQLLAFARKQTVVAKVLDLNETVESMLKMLRRLIGEDIELGWFPGSGLWPVRMDPGQIDQVLANLCVNARDAIVGVGTLLIETGNRRLDAAFCAEHPGCLPGDYVQLMVRDSGGGMDEVTLKHVFEPFFTTKEPGRGTGLGLATVYGIVKQNAGAIEVESQLGHGTTFRLCLPRWLGSPESGEVTAPPIRTGHGETVLLVEDEPAMLDVAGMMLQTLGYRVLAAGSPSAALRLSAEHAEQPIHLLLTDVLMPELNGAELAERLHQTRPALHVVFMSGYPSDVLARRGVDVGSLLLAKPFTARDLASKVDEALRGSGHRCVR